MESINKRIAMAIKQARKDAGISQIELAKKICYSDKAISRWENGEVTPDVDTLYSLSQIYNVPLSYLFEEHEEKHPILNQTTNKLAVALLGILAVWTTITIGFVYLRIVYDYTFWQLFVWAVPISALLAIYYNRKFWNVKTLRTIALSILNWFTLAGIYLQLLDYNLWLIFLIGIPIQACILVAHFMDTKK